jgi:hypothetical protein
MKTDQLIRTLAGQLKPTPRHGIRLRMAVAVGCGVVMALWILLDMYGTRPDLQEAVLSPSFWAKWVYTIPLCVLAGAMTLQLARPGTETMRAWWLALPAVAFALVAGAELASSPLPQWHDLWLGHSALRCPERVELLAVPIFAGLCMALRQMAPTRLRTTGAVAGIAAGACAATIYALSCDEVSASFVVTWYSVGIALSAAMGTLTGPWLLRW